jgi:hypothetical protein
MSVAYAVPMYVGLSVALCLSYGCVECTKHKGKLDKTSKIILGGWCIVSMIIASIVAGASSSIMTGMTNTTLVVVALLLVCVSLIISSSMIYLS